MHPFISVIIPCYNGAKFLQRSVGCTLSQTFEDFECIIVDDASPDNTREVAESLMQQDSRVKYVYNTDKHGLGGVRNFGIKHAKGEWVQFYDVDDCLYPDKIKLQLDFLKKNNIDTDQEMVLYSDYEVIWEDAEGNVERTMTNIVGSHTNKELLHKIMSWSEGANMPFHLNSTLFKKKIFADKLFNEDFFAFEEIELFVYLLHKNIQFEYIPTVAMSYRIHETNVTKDIRRSGIGYIQFIEEIYKLEPSLVQFSSPRIEKLLQRAMNSGDKSTFDSIISIIKRANIPAHLTYKGFIIDNPLFMQLAFFLRNPSSLVFK